MNVSVKCFATLAEADTCDFNESRDHEVEAGAKVGTLLQRLAIPADTVKLVFINGRQTGTDADLSDGDRVAFAPVVGGM